VENKKDPSWYESWFNSPYYHVLYGNRDQQEADMFIDRLVDYLKPVPGSHMLDLACGKGRHALALHQRGFKVTGIDLSEENISQAKKFETEGLNFYVHDMRRPCMINYFDGVFNLFTSFGYFGDLRDDQQVIDSVCKSLKKGGFFVIDFFNSKLVGQHIAEQPQGEKSVNGINFTWNKRIEDDHIVKEIDFIAEGKPHHYEERVQLLHPEDFRHLLAGHFELEMMFGDYSLAPFEKESSKRLIIVARKR
jgi:SAM-dependent methyltransferase